MLSAKARLAVAAALFLGWLGWLGYLVSQTREPIVLSRPQFLVSNLHVIATLTGSDTPDTEVTIKEVAWAGSAADIKAGDRINIPNLKGVGPDQGWRGPGDYILPLMKWKDGTYRITPVPPSPGYNPSASPGAIRVYPATEAARAQLAAISPERQ
jgi:hypothetical protein